MMYPIVFFSNNKVYFYFSIFRLFKKKMLCSVRSKAVVVMVVVAVEVVVVDVVVVAVVVVVVVVEVVFVIEVMEAEKK